MTWPNDAARVTAGEPRDQPSDSGLRSGASLPSVSQLAGGYPVSRQPALAAAPQHLAAGLVLRVPGRGTLAAPPGHDILRASPAREQAR